MAKSAGSGYEVVFLCSLDACAGSLHARQVLSLPQVLQHSPGKIIFYFFLFTNPYFIRQIRQIININKIPGLCSG